MEHKHKTVLIAGATGYLGQYLVQAYSDAGFNVRALVRSIDKCQTSPLNQVECFAAEATIPETIIGCCDGIDIVVSALGITRQKDGLTYEQVDYQANRNILDEALKSGVKHFAYVHVLNAEKMPKVAMACAKAKFASELKAAPIDSTIICPSGFFSDLEEIFQMAERGRVYLFGGGEALISPIHGSDLARLCIQAIEAGDATVEAGGPETWSQNDIAEFAFLALGRAPKITHIPLWVGRAFVRLAKVLGKWSGAGALEFFLAASALDMSASNHGSYHLIDAFKSLAHPTKNEKTPL